MQKQDTIATNHQKAKKAPAAPKGDRKDIIKRPNLVRLARFLDQQEDPEKVMKAYISLLEVCSDKGDEGLGEFEITIGDIATRLNETHFFKKIG